MPTDLNVRVYLPQKLGADFVNDISAFIGDDYSQANRLMGGYWRAGWTMNDNMSPRAKVDFFNNRIGFEIQAFSGGIRVFQGLIWEMDLEHNGILRRISMDRVINRSKAIFQDVANDNRKEGSQWFDNEASQARYGIIEEYVYLDRVTEDTADKYAQTVLEELAWPAPQTVMVRTPGAGNPTRLRITVSGYVFTLNYQYVTVADSQVDIGGGSGTAIYDAVTTDSEFVIVGSIAANTAEVKPPQTEVKVWDWILDLAQIGDGSQPYHLEVYDDLRLNYKAQTNEPNIFFDGSRLITAVGRPLSVDKYTVRPGILRDLSWMDQPLADTYFLGNQRDSIVTEVEATRRLDLPILKGDETNDSELLAGLAKMSDLFEED